MIEFASLKIPSKINSLQKLNLVEIPVFHGSTCRRLIVSMDLRLLTMKIARSENLPVLPTVVIQILKLFDDRNVSARSLVHIIEKDAGMSAKVLRVAGSPMYGLRSVNTVERAISILGMSTLRSIAISLAYQQILNRKGQRPAFDQMAFWRNSLAVGIGARELMRHVNGELAEEMYVAGLMHGVGVLALDRFAQPELTNALKTAAAQRIPLREAEMMVNGFDHCQVGGILADKWQLSQIVSNVIKYHDTPHEDNVTQQSTLVAAGASYLAYHCGFPVMPGLPGSVTGLEHLSDLELSQDKIDSVASKIMAEVDAADEAMSSNRAA